MSDRWGPSEDCMVCGHPQSYGHFVHCGVCGKDMCSECFKTHDWCGEFEKDERGDLGGISNMQCSFERKINHSDGSFTHTVCIQEANILFVDDPCFGLCYICAYNKLKAENKRLKADLKRALRDVDMFENLANERGDLE